MGEARLTEWKKQGFYKALGRRCQQLRRKRGWTQEDMADRGFSTRFYQRIEAGKAIHFDTILRLRMAFGISLSQLFKGLG